MANGSRDSISVACVQLLGLQSSQSSSDSKADGKQQSQSQQLLPPREVLPGQSFAAQDEQFCELFLKDLARSGLPRDEQARVYRATLQAARSLLQSKPPR